MSRTARNTHLHEVIQETFLNAGLALPTLVERRYFDETEGQALLEETSLTGIKPAELPAKFVACAAFAALWKFAESCMESRLQANAVRVVFKGAADTMVIDSNTAKLLELVVGNDGNGGDQRERGSVFGLFSCKTPGGARLLRQSLLQPSAVVSEITVRQDAVEALCSNDSMLFEVQRLLPSVGDVDVLAARLAAEPRTRGPKWCKAAVRTAMRLRQALDVLPTLADVLKAAPAGSTLLAEACVAFSDGRLSGLLEELERVLDSSGPPVGSKSGSMSHAAMLYSVRTGISALLDIARQTWNDALEQVHTLHRAYATKNPEANIKLEFTERRGWYLSHEADAVPSEFLRTAQKGRSGRMASTTRELNTENFKLRQAEREILTQTIAVLGGLFTTLRDEALLLYNAAHAACSLDLAQAFATYSLSLGDCVRPEISDDASAPIAIKAGRHLLLDKLLSRGGGGGRFEPLDFFVGPACHFQTVTGPNGGGKSTYLHTLAQLVVLGQIGCFIPAKIATMRVTSSLFTRIGTSDCIEASASTFLVEMQEVAHVLSDASATSLVIVDELGRGTAHADGLSICWAVCEKLIELGVFTLFATHLFEVCRLQSLYPGFRNMHIQPGGAGGTADTLGRGVGTGIEARQPQYVVRRVTSLDAMLATAQTQYGIRTAEEAGFPEELIQRAKIMASKVSRRLDVQLPAGKSKAGARGDRSVGALVARRGAGGRAGAATGDSVEALDAAERLLSLASDSTLSTSTLVDMLQHMQAQWRPRCPAAGSADGAPGGA